MKSINMTKFLSKFSWWLKGKEKEQASNGSPKNSNMGEPESVKFYSVKGDNRRMPSSNSSRKMKRKWKSREERKGMDKEYDVVLVPSDGVCLSASESDDSDWSIGWLEPHAPGFQSDDEADDSFAVLVPCYGNENKKFEDGEEEEPRNQLLSAIKNLPNEFSAEGKKYMEQWLSSPEFLNLLVRS